MPLTPLHLGPGILFKAFAGSHLSLCLFALTQVTMDLEVLLRLAIGGLNLHGYTNSVLGGTAVLLLSVPLGKPVCEWGLRWWNRRLNEAQARWLGVAETISWRAAWIGGVLGVYSHVFLDAMMHADASPWGPFSEANPFIGLLSIDRLNLLCLLSVLAGTFIVGLLGLLRNSRRADGRGARP